MGEIDTTLKNFLKINSVFSQLFSQCIFQGRITISPNDLRELDTVIQGTTNLADGQLKSIERLRDVQKIAMLTSEGIAFQMILSVEAQTDIHYYMPVRCMELDALSYSQQCKQISKEAKEAGLLNKYSNGVPKGTKIIPVVTAVFYYGHKPWDGPVCIHDLLNIPENFKSWADQTIPNYSLNLIDAFHIPVHEIQKFKDDLKAFLLLLKEDFDKPTLENVVAYHRETWYAVSKIKNDDRYRQYIDSISDDDLIGGIHMCDVLDRYEAKGEARGISIGEAIGLSTGISRVNRLAQLLAQEGRMDDFIRSTQDPVYQQTLFAEFHLNE